MVTRTQALVSPSCDMRNNGIARWHFLVARRQRNRFCLPLSLGRKTSDWLISFDSWPSKKFAHYRSLCSGKGCTFLLFFCAEIKVLSQRLRWSRGSVLAFGTQVRGFKPGRSRRTFQGEKILSTPSFGEEVKPSVPCRIFTACKRFLNVTWKSVISGKIHRPFLAHIIPPLATRISGETTSGESWNI